MASRRTRFAFCALLALGIWQLQLIAEAQQQYFKPGQRQTTSQKKTGNQNGQQSMRVATKSQQGAQAKPQAKATSIEKLDPEKRAAFLKLIGANWIWSSA